MAKLFRFILLIPVIPLIFAFSYEALLFLPQIDWQETLYWCGLPLLRRRPAGLGEDRLSEIDGVLVEIRQLMEVSSVE